MIKSRLGNIWNSSVLIILSVLLHSGCDPSKADQNDLDRLKGSHEQVRTDSSFAFLIESISEKEGYFDTDNLISNERSYLHVIDELNARDIRGSAYIGVGPGQNFSYLAHIQPEIAFIVDIRRDNLLQHLWYKALFEVASNRLEFLCLTFGRPPPQELDSWHERPIEELLEYIDNTALSIAYVNQIQSQLRNHIDSFGLDLVEEEYRTIAHIHERFIQAGPGLQFNSHYRSPRPYYPTFRQLMLETDRAGQQATYLAKEAAFKFVKTMQHRDLIIPVVGDLSGNKALSKIGEYLTANSMEISAFYTSNIEYYLMQDGRFNHFADNVASLPRSTNGVLVRSYFHRFRQSHPATVAGYASTQLLQSFSGFLEEYESNRIQSYWDLVSYSDEVIQD